MSYGFLHSPVPHIPDVSSIGAESAVFIAVSLNGFGGLGRSFWFLCHWAEAGASVSLLRLWVDRPTCHAPIVCMWWLGCAPGIAGPVLLYLTAQVPGWAVEVGDLHEVCLVVFGHQVFPGPHFSLFFYPLLHGYIGRSGLQTAWAII